MNAGDVKIDLAEHSQAKVALYGRYWSIYLNILSRVSSVDQIFLFDVMCGEGIYANGRRGSPIIALDAIEDHYRRNENTCPNCSIWFNDNGLSEIEDRKYKIDRVREAAATIFCPSNVNIRYTNEDYENILPEILRTVGAAPQSKGLLFVDPYGYKMIKPAEIREALRNPNIEMLLFLPASHMYRFASKAISAPFAGGKHLADFLQELFPGGVPKFSSPEDFITQLQAGFRIFLAGQQRYVCRFTMKHGANTYCLLFFTSSLRGLEKMVEAQWSIDKTFGEGYDPHNTPPMFGAFGLSDWENELEVFIKSANSRTNEEIFVFSLENGRLPKHSNEILRNWLKTRPDFKVDALDGREIRRNSAYIGNRQGRRVACYFKN